MRVGVVYPHQEIGDDPARIVAFAQAAEDLDRKSTRLNSSHSQISYAVFCLKKKKKQAYKCSVLRASLTMATSLRRTFMPHNQLTYLSSFTLRHTEPITSDIFHSARTTLYSA